MKWLPLCAVAALCLLVPTDELSTNPIPQSMYQLRASVLGSVGAIGASAEHAMTGAAGQPAVGDGMASGKALYNGFCAEPWDATPVDVSITVDCPRDTLIPSHTDLPHIKLSGFTMTNRSSMPMVIGYTVSSEGVARLANGGEPASLSGTSPLLVPYASFSPPQAVLVIPRIHHYRDQTVAYHHVPVGSPALEDSCATLVVFEAPVAVYITTFDAHVLDDGVRLAWDLAYDEPIKGFKIYRQQGAGVEAAIGPLAPGQREYTDNDVLPAQAYHYTLGVVRDDDSEIRSHAILAKTRVHALTLHQNYPNPFNPTTTISFALPAQSVVRLSIHSVRGELVKTLVSGTLDPGLTEVVWDATNANGDPVSSGVYLCKLATERKVLVKKMVLLK